MSPDDDPAAESDLAEVLDLIAGRGKYRGHGAGLETFPAGDRVAVELHAQCLELERRGLVRRKRVEPDAITWEARPGLKAVQPEGDG